MSHIDDLERAEQRPAAAPPAGQGDSKQPEESMLPNPESPEDSMGDKAKALANDCTTSEEQESLR